MRRKAILTAFVVALLLLASVAWLSWPVLLKPWHSTFDTYTYGSSHLFKGPQAGDKVIVMAKMEGDNVEWVTDRLPDWQQAIYHMDDPKWILHPPVNKGREAMAFLTFVSHLLRKLLDHLSLLRYAYELPRVFAMSLASNAVSNGAIDHFTLHCVAGSDCLPSSSPERLAGSLAYGC